VHPLLSGLLSLALLAGVCWAALWGYGKLTGDKKPDPNRARSRLTEDGTCGD
jgi:hypothetical protein